MIKWVSWAKLSTIWDPRQPLEHSNFLLRRPLDSRVLRNIIHLLRNRKWLWKVIEVWTSSSMQKLTLRPIFSKRWITNLNILMRAKNSLKLRLLILPTSCTCQIILNGKYRQPSNISTTNLALSMLLHQFSIRKHWKQVLSIIRLRTRPKLMTSIWTG